MNLRCCSVSLVLAACLAAPASGQAPVGGGSAKQRPSARRISLGLLAGASLGSTRVRTTRYPNPAGTARIEQVPGSPIPESSPTVIDHVQHGAVAPLAGALVAVRLDGGFSVQAALSYRHLPTAITVESYLGETAEQQFFSSEVQAGRSFIEVPTLLTYRFNTIARRPFVGFGPAFRVFGNRRHEARYGVVAAFGFDLHRSQRWTLIPQVRYVRWVDGAPEAFRAPPKSRLQAAFALTF